MSEDGGVTSPRGAKWLGETSGCKSRAANIRGFQGGGGAVKVGWVRVGVGGQNSIAFGSAPRREADSQPISQLARPAVSQTKTHSLGFLSMADPAPSSGEDLCSQGKQWPNGNAADCRLFGPGFEPRLGEDGVAAADDSRPTRIRTADLQLCSRLHYHSTGV